jgi:hypothetical protein
MFFFVTLGAHLKWHRRVRLLNARRLHPLAASLVVWVGSRAGISFFLFNYPFKCMVYK